MANFARAGGHPNNRHPDREHRDRSGQAGRRYNKNEKPLAVRQPQGQGPGILMRLANPFGTGTALFSALPFHLSSLARGPSKPAPKSAYASAPSLRLLSMDMDHLLSSVGAIIKFALNGVKKNPLLRRKIRRSILLGGRASGGQSGPDTCGRRRAESAL